MSSAKLFQVADLACLLIIGLINALLGLVIPPYRRGFFCNDDSIKYPYSSKESLPNWVVIIVSVIVPVSVIISCEVGKHWYNGDLARQQYSQDGDENLLCGPYTKKPVFQRVFKIIYVFLYGTLVNLLFTLFIKIYVGQLRPHFLAVCKPNMSLINCSDGYITNYVCTGTDEAAIERARRSFPSAHSSGTMYGMLFLALYFETLFVSKNKGFFLKPFIQCGCIMVSLFFGLNRVREHMHSWTDISAGFALGAVMAIYMMFRVLRPAELSGKKPAKVNTRRDVLRTSADNNVFLQNSPVSKEFRFTPELVIIP